MARVKGVPIVNCTAVFDGEPPTVCVYLEGSDRGKRVSGSRCCLYSRNTQGEVDLVSPFEIEESFEVARCMCNEGCIFRTKEG